MFIKVLTFAGWAAVLTLLGIGAVVGLTGGGVVVPFGGLLVSLVGLSIDQYLGRIKDRD